MDFVKSFLFIYFYAHRISHLILFILCIVINLLMLKHPSIPRICQVVHGVHSFQLPVQYFVWKDISKEFCTNVHQIYFFVLSFLSSAYLRWQFLRTLCHLSVPHQWAINFQYMLGEISFQIFQILVYRYKYKYIDI